MTPIGERLEQATTTATATRRELSSALAAMPDAELTRSVALAEDLARETGLIAANLAAEVARRSRPSMGDAGLAAREGFLNAESLLRSLTRTSYADAARRVRVGTLLAEADGADLNSDPDSNPSPTATAHRSLEPIARALESGELGVEAADGVIRALLPIVADAEPVALRNATRTLAEQGAEVNADDLGSMARSLRDTIDRVGLAEREQETRSRRSLRKGRMIDGLRRVSLTLDPESDATLMGALDHAMSPRLGGPRFVDPADQARAARLVEDDRTNEQLALDILVDLVRIGVDRDDGRILGATKPAVRVTIPLEDLVRMSADDPGVGWMEGSGTAVTAATARRILCDSGAIPIVLGGTGEPLDLGRGRRLFSAAQRVALAERDGGCCFTECDRPPSWCEAHHIVPFGKGGSTDLANGVLLCRRHHLLVHNYGWQIARNAFGELELTPPAGPLPAHGPRSMSSARKRTGKVRGRTLSAAR